MNNDMFYGFGSKLSNSAVYLDNDLLNWDISLELIIGNYSNIPIPFPVKQKSGKKWFDILCPSVGLYIVSDKFVNLLKKNKITGWKTFPIVVTDKQGAEVEGYNGFSVTGHAGKIDYSRSEIIEKKAIPNGVSLKYYKGCYFDEKKWDKTDIFILEDTIRIVVTEKVYRVITDNKITNCELKNLSDYETNVK